MSQNTPSPVFNQRVWDTSSYNNYESNRYPGIYLLYPYGSEQICNSSSRLTVNYFKPPFTGISKFGAYYKSLNYIFRHTSAGYARLCKLMLFPFHVFW